MSEQLKIRELRKFLKQEAKDEYQKRIEDIKKYNKSGLMEIIGDKIKKDEEPVKEEPKPKAKAKSKPQER